MQCITHNPPSPHNVDHCVQQREKTIFLMPVLTSGVHSDVMKAIRSVWSCTLVLSALVAKWNNYLYKVLNVTLFCYSDSIRFGLGSRKWPIFFILLREISFTPIGSVATKTEKGGFFDRFRLTCVCTKCCLKTS